MKQRFERSLAALAAVVLGPALAVGQMDFDPAVTYSTGIEPDQTATGDFDGDGAVDLVVSSDTPDKVAFYFNDGTGAFGAPVDFLLGNNTSPSAVAAADFDGDGDLDVGVALKSNQVVQILTNLGGGTFAFGGAFAVGVRPVDIEVAMLNADSAPDMAVSNRDGNSVTILLNDGSGSFSGSSISAGAEPREVSAADLDQDGDLDLAVGAHDSRAIQLLINDGAGGFSTGPSLSVGAQLRPEGVVGADFDNDGDADLAAATSGNGQNWVSVWTQSTPGSFTGPVHYAAGGLDPSVLVAADFDLDGNMDVAVVNKDSNDLSALRGFGNATFDVPVVYSVSGVSPDHLAKGDFDGNGGMDLVSSNRDSNSISVFRNRNGGIDPWEDLGKGLAGTNGVPVMEGSGSLRGGEIATITVTNALPFGRPMLIIGFDEWCVPFMGGFLVPSPDFIFRMPRFDVNGELVISSTWPDGIPPGSEYFFQIWFADGGAVEGMAATNGLKGTAQ